MHVCVVYVCATCIRCVYVRVWEYGMYGCIYICMCAQRVCVNGARMCVHKAMC